MSTVRRSTAIQRRGGSTPHNCAQFCLATCCVPRLCFSAGVAEFAGTMASFLLNFLPGFSFLFLAEPRFPPKPDECRTRGSQPARHAERTRRFLASPRWMLGIEGTAGGISARAAFALCSLVAVGLWTSARYDSNSWIHFRGGARTHLADATARRLERKCGPLGDFRFDQPAGALRAFTGRIEQGRNIGGWRVRLKIMARLENVTPTWGRRRTSATTSWGVPCGRIVVFAMLE